MHFIYMERHYTLKEASKILGVTVKTLQNWDKQGKIRVIRTPGGRRSIPESEIKRILGIHEERKVVGYARVSSRTQKDDLKRQVQAIQQYAKEKGWNVEILKDISSGLNEKRKNSSKWWQTRKCQSHHHTSRQTNKIWIQNTQNTLSSPWNRDNNNQRNSKRAKRRTH
ncbi:hypothetical protein PF1985 [Pyrococcus furiosus DSM 3638]|uniref:HTH merR-type domain-containing protein n=1 Tax=Pyrococcus furiosus (strain ATCC 43587 / DSM 3638 / JCM 8422 / Vc1) TaxID=186497 RepID=Q8TZK6_PYRFU|nr:hypothetical protein PF1985 [Pyrococcus furiosus DSM 3638]